MGVLILFFLLVYPLSVAGATALVRALRPDWRGWSIVLAANAPGPVLALGAAGVLIATLGTAPPGETDATGMALALYMVGGLLGAGAMLVVGLPAGWAALKLLPAPAERP